MTITEAFTRFDNELYATGKKLKTRKNYKSAYVSLIAAIGDIPIELLTFDHIATWQMLMRRNGKQPSTIKGELCRLRQVLCFFRERGVPVIDYRDIKLPSVPKKEPVWLEANEVRQFLQVITSPRDKAIFASLFGTGARISELLQLDRDSIVNGEAHIIGKGSKPGILYFDDYSLSLIEHYLDGRHDSLRPLFISGQYRRITVSRVEQLAHIYEDMSGISKNMTPHILRHSFASDLIYNGADLYTVKEQLRHSSIATTQIYTHVKQDQIKRNYQMYHTKIHET